MDDLHDLTRAWGIVNVQRDEVRSAGAPKAAKAISRALKSLDGAIRHAKRVLIQEGNYDG